MLDDGSSWIFYGGDYRDERARVQLATPASARLTDPRGGGQFDARLLFLRDDQSATTQRTYPGVATFWLSADVRDENPLNLKHSAEEDQRRLRNMVEALGCRWDDVGRIFVFVASQVDSNDLAVFVNQNAMDVATLFTGGLEDETDECLLEHLNENVSTRRYERFYLRWTDGLALYDNTERGRDDRELATMRALRIVETGLLMRRLLRDVSYDLTQLSTRVSARSIPFVSKPWKEGERIKRTVSEARLTTMVAPPVHSVEGEALLEKAFARFGIPELVASVERLEAELQRRLDWNRVLWLAVWAGMAFATPLFVGILVRG